jgi:hypothetical protein
MVSHCVPSKQLHDIYYLDNIKSLREKMKQISVVMNRVEQSKTDDDHDRYNTMFQKLRMNKDNLVLSR